MTPRRRRRLAAGLLAAAGLVDVVLAAVPAHALRLGWDAVPAYGWQRYALTAAGVACLALAPAVARGRREARWAGLAAASASALIAVVHDADVAAFIPSAAAILGLAATGPLPGRADPLLARRALQTLVVGEAAVFLYAAVGLYLLDANFREATSVAASLGEALRMLFLLPPAAIRPATEHGMWFLDSVRWLSALVLGAACLRALAPSLARARRREERARVDALLRRWATSSLAPFQLLDDKHWCFSPDGDAFVGYALSGSTAVALGGPIGAPRARAAALRAFLQLCDRQGWQPALHQLDEHEARDAREAGLQLVKIGEEAIVDVDRFALTGGTMKPIRKAVNRAEREGLTVAELEPPLAHETLQELREVSDAWLSSSGHRERGFTLGRFDGDVLRAQPVVLVRDGAGRAVAFANIVPSYRGTIGNFDLMRRVPDAPRGAMELLFVALIERFRALGLSGMSLGLAPLAGATDDGLVGRALGVVRDRSGFLNFAGLEEFKAKWRPRWEPRYFACGGAGELPRSAAATALAGERPGRGPTADAVARIARRFPASIGLGAVLLWLMAATAGDAAFHGSLVARFALSWPQLAALELWRVPSSALVQEDVGLRLSIIGLMAALPLAEMRLGWRLTLVAFFAGDAVSSIGTLAALQLLGGLGVGGASELAAEPNLGSSAGLIALLAGAAATLRAGRRRPLAAAALGVALAVALALERDLASLQHVVAAAAGGGLALLAQRRAGSEGAAGRAGLGSLGDARRAAPRPAPVERE